MFCGDIRDPNRVAEAVRGIDVVFHLVSLADIPYSYIAPDSYVDTNIKGTMNLLNACLYKRPTLFISFIHQVLPVNQRVS